MIFFSFVDCSFGGTFTSVVAALPEMCTKEALLSAQLSAEGFVFSSISCLRQHMLARDFPHTALRSIAQVFKYIATVRIAEKNIEITCWVSLKMKILQFVSNLKWTYVGQKAGMISWQGRRTSQLVSTCGVEVLMSHGLHGLFDFFAFSEQDDFSAMQISWT